MISNTDQLVNLVYVEDLARGIVQAAFSPRSAGKCYFLCEETSYRWSEFARLLGQVMNKKYITIKIPYFVIYLLSLILEKSASYVGTTTIFNRQKMKELKRGLLRNLTPPGTVRAGLSVSGSFNSGN